MKKVVILTGSSRGIGAATAKLLASMGYSVCVNYKNRREEAESVVSAIETLGSEVFSCRADVSREAEVIKLFDTTEARLGPVTHLVNNAGILFRQSAFVDLSADRINQILSTNVTSCFLCCREAIRRMKKEGAIVNVSSVAARTGAPGEYMDYAASKGAVDSLTKGLAKEMAARNIRVNGVRPGFIHTDIHADGGEPDRIQQLQSKIPLQRGGHPEEVARAIAWLLSEEASYVTGSFIDTAGGV